MALPLGRVLDAGREVGGIGLDDAAILKEVSPCLLAWHDRNKLLGSIDRRA